MSHFKQQQQKKAPNFSIILLNSRNVKLFNMFCAKYQCRKSNASLWKIRKTTWHFRLK